MSNQIRLFEILPGAPVDIVPLSGERTFKLCGNCGEPHNRVGPTRPQSYCRGCHAAYMRANRPKHSELTPEQRFKANARSYANTYKNRGYIEIKPCENCSAPDAQMHHEDYSKPTAVTWLCRDCHLDLHRSEHNG